MKKYFIYDGQYEKGPFDIEELKKLGVIRDTPVWYQGLEGWTIAGEVDELQVLFLLIPKPPPIAKQAFPPTQIPKNQATILPTSGVSVKKINPVFIWIVLAAAVIAAIFFFLNTNKNTHPLDTVVNGPVTKEGRDTISPPVNLDEKRVLSTEDQEKRTRDSLSGVKNRDARNNWMKYLLLTQTDAIENENGEVQFDVIVVNNFDYIMDEVTIKVRLEDENANLIDNENITFRFIQPKDKKKQTYIVKKQGVSSYSSSVSRITARAMHLCYNAEKDLPANRQQHTPEDKWYCD